MRGQLTQKVNFIVSATFIATFGFFLTVTIVQALNDNSPLWGFIATPIELRY
ncbi:MAG: hypothetical protein Q7S75_00270 [bacterium]|nr:hypothetical protein [bacterium]